MAAVVSSHLRLRLGVTRRLLQGTTTAVPVRRMKSQESTPTFFLRLRPVCSNVLNVQLQIYRNAGHSHWQNIKNIKGAKDAEKSKNANMIMLKLRNAVKQGESADPKLNKSLANVLEEAQKKGVPKTTTMEYLRKLGDRTNYKIHTIEAKGPGQSLFMFEVFTDKPIVVESAIQGVLKRNQGRVGNKKGFASFGFDKQGFITVEAGGELTLDAMTDLAIECEAEEVEEVTDEEGQTNFQLSCPGDDLFRVKGNLEKAKVVIKDASTIWVPKNRVILTGPEREMLDRIFTKLQMIEDIEEIYDNVELES